MGSCSVIGKIKSVKSSGPEVTEYSTIDRRTINILNQKQLQDERKMIFINKDKNAPRLCITSSLLYNRRLQQKPIE
ncbi:hypothetical protein SteCoe_22420 [Stentor coeruleus]|uniref:Uncharacterized protein n=1 Tax=Stentor coeruleus TaxID=5963 RepID=A0A1R2BME5_9CILI|nr:hypothetical protein SteCoe_22420 [Stentor coeruleus]